MSGQSQEPANTDYGLGTDTGTDGIWHELGTNWTRASTAWIDWTRTGHGHRYETRHEHK
jgi:hypothetical protein